MLRHSLVFSWALAEATVWPVMPDAILAPLAAAFPREWPGLTVAATLGSTAGGLISYRLGRSRPIEPILARLPLVRAPMVAAARAELVRRGASGLRSQPFSGVPFKVYALLAGTLGIRPLPFALYAAAARGFRFLLVCGISALVGRSAGPWLRRWPASGGLLVLWSVVFALGLLSTVRAWEARGQPPD